MIEMTTDTFTYNPNDRWDTTETGVAPEATGPARVLMSGKETGGRFALIQMVVRREHEPPSHLHIREDEVLYVVEGTIVVSIGGERAEYTAGEAVFLPRGREHGYLLRTDEARLLVLALPAGIEGFYMELEAAMDVERLIALAARYGVEITGPGLREMDAAAGDGDGAPIA